MLELTVFCSGALVMILEMVWEDASLPRLWASAIVWTKRLIGVVLAFLALGAWAGGRYAGQEPVQPPRPQHGLALAWPGLAARLRHFATMPSAAASRHLWATSHVAAVCRRAISIFALPAPFLRHGLPLRYPLIASGPVLILQARLSSGTMPFPQRGILGSIFGGFVLISWFFQHRHHVVSCHLHILLSLLNNLKTPRCVWLWFSFLPFWPGRIKAMPY